MDGLRTTRVLVIDDRRDEAQGVIDALARDGIGAVYYSQDVRTHPRKPLTGIRLAALDMNLEDLPTSDPVAATATILSVLRNLVDENNGPYLAIAWTKHKELVDEFRRRAAGLPCPPIASVSLIKPRTGQYNFASIARRLKTALDDSYPLGFLGFWEQLVHDSTSDIIQMVSPASDWPVETKKTLATLLRDSASTRDLPSVKLRALLETMNSLQFDLMETQTALLKSGIEKRLVEPLTRVRVPKKGPPDLAGKLNWQLLFGEPLPGPAPGNIYELDTLNRLAKPLFPSLDTLLDDMVNENKKEEVVQAGCTPMIMEITPLCDYQQRKAQGSRFICGVAIPELNDSQYKSKFKDRAEFIRRIGPTEFNHQSLKGRNMLLWNSHFLVSLPLKRVPKRKAPFRLRQAPLMDIQAWVGSHAARPGFLSIG